MFDLDNIFSNSKTEVIDNLKKAMIIKENWPNIAGKVLAKELSVSFVRQGVLALESKNPCWISEIQFYEEELLRNINAYFKKNRGINKIKIRQAKKGFAKANKFA